MNIFFRPLPSTFLTPGHLLVFRVLDQVSLLDPPQLVLLTTTKRFSSQ